MMRTVTIGVLGCGAVGQDILNIIEKRQSVFHDMNVHIDVVGVLVRNPQKTRHIPANTPLTDNPSFLRECEILIEAIGGIDRPLELMRPHLRSGRSVITANKALLAERWNDLQEHALDGRLYYEASVMAGTPIIGPMSTVLRASTFKGLQAVLNGTCNYILTKMEEGLDYASALKQAQELGYAEDPPHLDVQGFDSAHKLAILSRFCIDGNFPYKSIQVQGIEHLTSQDITDALQAGERYKLIATLRQDHQEWQASVLPTRLPKEHALCSSGSTRNGLLFEGEECGPLLFAGAGAGGMVTASAMVGDLLDYLLDFPGHVPLH